MEGYVKLWRKTLESSMWENHNLLIFWIWCLLKATYKARIGKVGFQDVYLEPGQFVFGRRKAAKETKLSEQTIRTSLDSLRRSQNLTIKTTRKYSIISIVNWAKYQEEATQTLTNYQPTANPLLTTDKKGKKDKNVKKGIYGKFKNVLLKTEEYQELKDKFNSSLGGKIENLSEYIASKGKQYKSHYATILMWDRKDIKENPTGRVYKDL